MRPTEEDFRAGYAYARRMMVPRRAPPGKFAIVYTPEQMAEAITFTESVAGMRPWADGARLAIDHHIQGTRHADPAS